MAGANISSWVFWASATWACIALVVLSGLVWRKKRSLPPMILGVLALMGAIVGFWGYWAATEDRRATEAMTERLLQQVNPIPGTEITKGKLQERPGCGHAVVQESSVDQIVLDPALDDVPGQGGFTPAQFAAMESFATQLENQDWDVRRVETLDGVLPFSMSVLAFRESEYVQISAIPARHHDVRVIATRSRCIASAMGINYPAEDLPNFVTKFSTR